MPHTAYRPAPAPAGQLRLLIGRILVNQKSQFRPHPVFAITPANGLALQKAVGELVDIWSEDFVTKMSLRD